MPLVQSRYGKREVRVLRIHRGGDRHEVRELTVQAMVEGDFARAYTDADNSLCVSTDTIKNVINIVARENLALDAELFCNAVAEKLLGSYLQISSTVVSAHETKWSRLAFNGTPHPHSFVLDANGKPFSQVNVTRGSTRFVSGITGYTFMKSTGSGWDNYARDAYTTIVETRDRICATSMDASWTWSSVPADFAKTNEILLATMLEVFATTYSTSVQDSLYRMGEAALAAIPEISEIRMACPNKHYLPVNLSPFGLDNNNQIFLPTDEPHGQIECTIGR